MYETDVCTSRAILFPSTSVVQAMTVLNRDSFLKKRVSASADSVELPDGSLVLMRPASAKIYRDYRRSLKDKDGMPVTAKQPFGDEILLATLMVDADGNQMFTEEDVVAGAFDAIDMAFLSPLIRKAYEMLGITEPEEDREKNLSTTASTEPS